MRDEADVLFRPAQQGNRTVIEPFEATLPANPAVLFAFRHSLREWLESVHLDLRLQDQVVLAVHEAVVNGMDHGVGGRPVVVSGYRQGREVIVEVSTSGSWTQHAGPAQLLDQRGRGLALMRGLLDGLEILDEGELVTLRLRVGGQAVSIALQDWQDEGDATF
jgi:anti-sigma regulatory factor (Ser/Thr protein kinase)